MEKWMEFSFFNKQYRVSDQGTVMSYSNGEWRLYRPVDQGNGYPVVVLKWRRIAKNILLSRLVASCFLKQVGGADFVNHKDGNKWNNKASNLEWVTREENMRHASRTGLLSTKAFGRKNVLNDRDVETIRALAREMSHAQIAKKFGVKRTYITDIVNMRKRVAH